MRVVFLALAFLAELAAWSALGVAAFVLAGGGWQGWVAAITTAAVVITVWGLVASPKAKARPPQASPRRSWCSAVLPWPWS
jgi:hypothetical protein